MEHYHINIILITEANKNEIYIIIKIKLIGHQEKFSFMTLEHGNIFLNEIIFYFEGNDQ